MFNSKIFVCFTLILLIVSCGNSDDDADPVGPYDDCSRPRENFVDTTNAAFNVFQAYLNDEPWLPSDNTSEGWVSTPTKLLINSSEQSLTFSLRRRVYQSKEHCQWAIPDINQTLIFYVDVTEKVVGEHKPKNFSLYRDRNSGYNFQLDTAANNIIVIESAFATEGSNLRVSGTMNLNFVAEEDPSVKAIFTEGVFRMTQNSY